MSQTTIKDISSPPDPLDGVSTNPSSLADKLTVALRPLVPGVTVTTREGDNLYLDVKYNSSTMAKELSEGGASALSIAINEALESQVPGARTTMAGSPGQLGIAVHNVSSQDIDGIDTAKLTQAARASAEKSYAQYQQGMAELEKLRSRHQRPESSSFLNRGGSGGYLG